VQFNTGCSSGGATTSSSAGKEIATRLSIDRSSPWRSGAPRVAWIEIDPNPSTKGICHAMSMDWVNWLGTQNSSVKPHYPWRLKMRLLAMGVAILAWFSTTQGAAQTANDLCSRATMTAAVGPITAETFSYGGVDRHYCVYTSSLIGAGTQHPLVIALHGGTATPRR
jgi:hypothetical protein